MVPIEPRLRPRADTGGLDAAEILGGEIGGGAVDGRVPTILPGDPGPPDVPFATPGIDRPHRLWS